MNERDRPVFFLLRLSFRATNDFPSFPFSGTHHVIGTNIIISSEKHDRQIIFGLQIVLDTCTTHLHDL